MYCFSFCIITFSSPFLSSHSTSPCLCCLSRPRSGISGGAGASDGPSTQYVQAGAEWCWCNTGETVEILWIRQPQFRVTQGERTHTLGKHINMNF